MDHLPGEITRLLRQFREGQSGAAEHLMSLVYRELHQVAARYMAREDRGHILQPTALVNEAYMRLSAKENLDWQSRTHFFAVAAREMRRVLVELARRRDAAKRGGPDVHHVSVDNLALVAEENLVDLCVLTEALDRLAAVDARQREIVEMRFFAGLTNEEIAMAMGISPRTVKREWSFARAWLLNELATSEG